MSHVIRQSLGLLTEKTNGGQEKTEEVWANSISLTWAGESGYRS